MISGQTILVVDEATQTSNSAKRAGYWMAGNRGYSVQLTDVTEGFAGTSERYHPSVPTSSWADALCASAAERQAALIILGTELLANHVRCPGIEGVLALAARSTIPLWIMPIGASFHPPRRILLGTDFSRASIRAGRTALQITGPTTPLDLVHVTSERSQSCRRLVEPAGPSFPELVMLFDAIDSTVGPSSQLPFRRTLLHGDPAPALLACTETRGTEMLALGSHGRHGRTSKKALGRVASQVVSAVMSGTTQCSVLLSGLLTAMADD